MQYKRTREEDNDNDYLSRDNTASRKKESGSEIRTRCLADDLLAGYVAQRIMLHHLYAFTCTHQTF